MQAQARPRPFAAAGLLAKPCSASAAACRASEPPPRHIGTSTSGCSQLQPASQQLQQSQRWRHRRRRWLAPPAAAAQPNSEGQELAAEFQSFVNAQGVPEPLRNRRPTHLMSPMACIEAQMDALQRNDWPEKDAGVQTAFLFAKCEDALDVLQAAPRRVRSWAAREEWLGLADFSNMLHSPPYSSMLNCDSWRPASPLVFPSSRHQNKAVCAVEVLGRARTTYTFCLEKMSTRGGPLWLTVGVRVGDYGNV